MIRIAFIDNQRDELAQVRSILSAESFGVDVYKDPQFALDSFQRRMPDLVVINLPTSKINGVALVEHIRASSIIPVVLLSTARDEIEEIMGLRYGADDYIHLPISARVLSERIKARLRRHSTLVAHGKTAPEAEKTLVCGDLTLDPSRHTVCWKAHQVNLTSTEFRLLHALVRRPGMVKTRDQLLTASYPSEIYVDNRTIDSHVKRVRNKLRLADPEFTSIETLYGIGYRFNPSADRPIAISAYAAGKPPVIHDQACSSKLQPLGRATSWPKEPSVTVLRNRI